MVVSIFAANLDIFSDRNGDNSGKHAVQMALTNTVLAVGPKVKPQPGPNCLHTSLVQSLQLVNLDIAPLKGMLHSVP